MVSCLKIKLISYYMYTKIDLHIYEKYRPCLLYREEQLRVNKQLEKALMKLLFCGIISKLNQINNKNSTVIM